MGSEILSRSDFQVNDREDHREVCWVVSVIPSISSRIMKVTHGEDWRLGVVLLRQGKMMQSYPYLSSKTRDDYSLKGMNETGAKRRRPHS